MAQFRLLAGTHEQSIKIDSDPYLAPHIALTDQFGAIGPSKRDRNPNSRVGGRYFQFRLENTNMSGFVDVFSLDYDAQTERTLAQVHPNPSKRQHRYTPVRDRL